MVGSRRQLSLWGSIRVLVCFTLSDRSTMKNAIVCNLKGNLGNYSHSIVFALPHIPTRLSSSFFLFLYCSYQEELSLIELCKCSQFAFIIERYTWASKTQLNNFKEQWTRNTRIFSRTGETKTFTFCVSETFWGGDSISNRLWVCINLN